MIQLLQAFQKMDRRWVFLGMALAVFIPLQCPLEADFQIAPEVQDVYDQVEKLPAGSPVLISGDFDPASLPEIGPFYTTHLHHLFRNDLKPVLVTLWPASIPIIYPEMERIAKIYGKEYGTDWVFLGYKEGKELVVKNIGQNIHQQFPSDHLKTPIAEIPLMKDLRQAKDFPLITSISAGSPGLTEYVLQIQGQYNLNIVGACTAVIGPDTIPFHKSGQLSGLSMGMPGSAQYEKLVWKGNPPDGVQLLATKSMDVLNVGHIYIIILILLGNIAYFLTRRVKES